MKNLNTISFCLFALLFTQIAYAQPKVGMAYSLTSNQPVFGCLDSVSIAWSTPSSIGAPSISGVSTINSLTGEWTISNAIPLGQSVLLQVKSAHKDYYHGVNIIDLDLLGKHILGLQAFDNPYKYFAADLNNSSSVTSADYAAIRKLLLGNNAIDFFANYRFLPSDLTFTNPNNPFNGTMGSSVYTTLNIPDFYAVKLGDLDGDACQPVTFAGVEILRTQEQMVQAGDEIELTFAIPSNLTTVQFQMSHSDLVLISNDNSMHSLNPGQTNVILMSAEFSTFKPRFRSNKTDLLSNLIGFSANTGKGVDAQSSLFELELQFTPTSTSDLNQFDHQLTAHPNPFTHQTILSGNFAKSQSVDIQIFDVRGKLVHAKTEWVNAGQNSLELDSAHLPQAGVYICLVRHDEELLTTQLVHLK